MQDSHSDIVGIQAIMSGPSRRGRALQTDGVGPGDPVEVLSTKTCSVLIPLDGRACYYIKEDLELYLHEGLPVLSQIQSSQEAIRELKDSFNKGNFLSGEGLLSGGGPRVGDAIDRDRTNNENERSPEMDQVVSASR
eukprot:15366660-Ditylum_brightwellii.AAC.1